MFRAALISLCLTSTALATTWTVDDDGKADFNNIQAAVDASSDGDEIIVMPGTYTGDGDEVVTIGKSVTIRSVSGPESTVIDCQSQRNGVRFASIFAGDSRLEGFTIKDSFWGLQIESYLMIEIVDCIIDDAEYAGIYASQTEVHLQSVTIQNCGNTTRGGMLVWEGIIQIDGCLFLNNTTTYDGGGISSEGSELTIVNSVFSGNSGGQYGGAVALKGGSANISNCTFSNNNSENYGGAVANRDTFSDEDGTLHIDNCMLTSNSSSFGGSLYNPNHVSACTLKFNSSSAGRGGGIFWNSNSVDDCILESVILCSNTLPHVNGPWIDGGDNCFAFDCSDEDMDGIPNECGVVDDGVHHVPAEYSSIQDAVVAAGQYDQILVAPGTYVGTGDFVIEPNGKRVRIQSIDGSEVTVLDGQYKHNALNCKSGESRDFLLEGFTIQQCSGYESAIELSYCVPTLRNLVIKENVAQSGGGLSVNEAAPFLESCMFIDNIGLTAGGGAYFQRWKVNPDYIPRLVNCQFINNQVMEGPGGGVFVRGYSDGVVIEFEGCTFENNSAVGASWAGSGGGGIKVAYSSIELSQTTLCGNDPNQIEGDWIDQGGNTITDECPPNCPDINGDGIVNVTDLLAVIDQWGLTDSPADVNADGIVDVSDLLIMVGSWGPCE